MTDAEILLKLRRKYSKDEEVKLIVKGLEFTIGEQKSYIHELEDKVNCINPDTKQLLTTILDLKKQNKSLRNGEELFKMNSKISEKNKHIKELQKSICDLIVKLNNPISNKNANKQHI
tara:strand:+ start:4558 stop:4911 length:354 start_codon:yes stop_codon:yes gene_type:complete